MKKKPRHMWVLETKRRFVVDFSTAENRRLAEIGDAHSVLDTLEAAADVVREDGVDAEILMRLPSGRAFACRPIWGVAEGGGPKQDSPRRGKRRSKSE